MPSATSSTPPAAACWPARARRDGRAPLDSVAAILRGELPERALAGMATTIGVIATDAVLTKAQANKLATMAHDGLARCIRPVHTMTDGDTLFALATGGSGRAGEMTVLGVMAAEVTARAVLNAVRAATGLPTPALPAARDLAPGLMRRMAVCPAPRAATRPSRIPACSSPRSSSRKASAPAASAPASWPAGRVRIGGRIVDDPARRRRHRRPRRSRSRAGPGPTRSAPC